MQNNSDSSALDLSNMRFILVVQHKYLLIMIILFPHFVVGIFYGSMQFRRLCKAAWNASLLEGSEARCALRAHQ